MKVLSLFDGMSCCQIALNRAGFKIDKYYASEIDKHAIRVTMTNYPDTIQLGDIRNVKGSDLPKIDFLAGGSPCQGFSFAGKMLNFDDPRSALFFEFVRIWKELKEINPDIKFLLENVRMSKESELVISNYMGIAPIVINSALVSAQNRVRLYWTNIAEKTYGLFNDKYIDIPQPGDKGILLKDILENDVDEKYFLSEKALARIERGLYSSPKINPDKTGTLNTKNNSGQLSIDSGTTLIIDINGNPKSNQDKAGCFTAGGHSGGNYSDMDLIIHSLHPRSGKGNGGKGHLSKSDNKSYSLETQSKQGVQVNYIQLDTGYEQSNRLYLEDGKIRRLTTTECERLQTVPDGYTSCVSDSQRYKMLGNGWTIEAIVHILNYMK